jgi:Ser/Thr protein kinase RdoA (MazF antagonist)
MTTPNTPEALRGVATLALQGFLDEACTLELLGHGQSLAYRVTAPSGEYLLRVHVPRCPPVRPEFLATEAIESECTWLSALAEETELVVQKPVRTPTGGYVLFVPRSGADDPVPCTLLSWVEGEHLPEKRTPEQAAGLGQLVAALRSHAARWKPPAGFVRPTHDRASWRTALARCDHLVDCGIASTADRDLLTRAIDMADHELAPLVHQPERIGLIHADLHGGNFVFHEGSPRPIDFGLAGFGPWLWDVAECVAGLGPARRRDFIDAYGKTWPLEDVDLRRIEGYFIATIVEVFGNNATDPTEHEYLARAIPGWAPHFQRYTDRTPFLLDL